MHGRRLATTEEIICIKTEDSHDALDELREWTAANNIELTEIAVGEDVSEGDYSEAQQTLGVTLGGDGTFLEGIRVFAPRNIPLMGVNTGTLAFLARVQPDELQDALDEVFRGRAEISDRQQLQLTGGGLDATGINDVMVQPMPPENPVDRKICRLHVFADEEYVGKYDGSGLAINTPTGSTGLALSAEGPIHYPNDDLTLQVTPLHTHSMGVRPLVISSERDIRVVPDDDVRVLVDGGRFHTMADSGDVLHITGAGEPAHVVRTSYDDAFFTAMTRKLGWGVRGPNEQGPRDALAEPAAGEQFHEQALRVAKEAARSAGEPVQELHGQVENVQYKDGDKSDIVTEADYQAENIITTVISNEFPTHGIQSEEDVQKAAQSEYIWSIDPLDGTGNFAHGNPNYSISISLLRDEEPIVGVVYAPETDEMFSAVRGEGAHRNGEPIGTTDRNSLDESMLLSGYDPKGTFLQSFYEETQGVRRIGSAALNLCYVATGSADGVWEYDTYPWDVAAGLLILREAGGQITDGHGVEYTLSLDNIEERRPLLASNGALHGALIEQLETIDAEIRELEGDVDTSDEN